MPVTIEDHVFKASSYLSEQERSRFIFALVSYGVDGTIPDENEPWYPLFIIGRTEVDLSSSPGRQLARKRWDKQLADEDFV